MPVSDKYKNVYIVSWDQLHRDCKELAWKLSDGHVFEGVLAVTRGGMFPAAVIARELEIRVIDTVSVVSYDWQQQGEARMVKPPAQTEDGRGWLIVDDLADTGKTARFLRELFPKAHYAMVYVKPEGKDLCDTYVTEVSQDTWILQPWDTETRFVEPIANLRKAE